MFFQLLVYLQAAHVSYISPPSNYLKSVKICKVFLFITSIQIANPKIKSSHGKESNAFYAVLDIY